MYSVLVILRSECGGTRWRTGGEVNGKLVNGVGSQYSHMASGRGVSSITNADAHTSAASNRLKWLPRRFKWTRPFRRKTKSGFCACAIRFRTSSNNQLDELFSLYLFISLLYMFRATVWYAGPSGPAYQTVTYTKWYIPDVLMQFDSRVDEHWVARNM